MDIKLFFKSLFVSDISNNAASFGNLTEDFGQVRTDHSFIRDKSEVRRLKSHIQI